MSKEQEYQYPHDMLTAKEPPEIVVQQAWLKEINFVDWEGKTRTIHFYQEPDNPHHYQWCFENGKCFGEIEAKTFVEPAEYDYDLSMVAIRKNQEQPYHVTVKGEDKGLISTEWQSLMEAQYVVVDFVVGWLETQEEEKAEGEHGPDKFVIRLS